jgi:DNA modification methylase
MMHGDCLDVMRELDECSIDAIVTDPPYGLKFMGKHWDHGVPGTAFWVAALRLLKPGARLLAFGGTRTYHRMACAIEDAGFEIEDSLCWLYGSGFPKHKSKLKPAHEPIVMARKPAPRATLLNIDACRLEPQTGDYNHPGNTAEYSDTSKVYGWAESQNASGRWPANVVLDEEAARALDEQSGERPVSGSAMLGRPPSGGHNAGFIVGKQTDRLMPNDTGGASRFFYCAKASRREREAGLDGFATRNAARLNAMGDDPTGDIDPVSARCEARARNHHPTVKPVALMRWLVRLVTPPDGLVLDPFTGSGTTGIAATLEGRRFVGIEREAEYVEIARARIAHAQPALGVA